MKMQQELMNIQEVNHYTLLSRQAQTKLNDNTNKERERERKERK